MSAIDGLRAIAALSVCVYHFSNTIADGRPHLWPEPFQSIADHGWAGVQIFFVLSGFVIAHSVRDQRITASFFGRFALRRSIRLDPPYWVVIALSIVALMLTGSAFPSAPTVVANMLYLDRLIGAPSLVKVGWTLALEIQFYLVFVLLIGVRQQVSRLGLLFVPLAIMSIGIYVKLIPLAWTGLFIVHWSFFFLGALVSWVLDGKTSARWLLALVGLELATRDAGPIIAAGTALAIYAMGRRGVLETALSNRALQLVGRISYSLYLIHPLVANRPLRRLVVAFETPPTGLTALALLLVALAAGLLASAAFYVAVEYPSWMLSKKVRLDGAPVVPLTPARALAD